MRFFHPLLALLTTISLDTIAQTTSDESAARLSPKEFTIPASPVFDLMGVTSSQVNRTSDIKDFKVDWSFKSWKLSPNLAIQSQPVWEVFYNRKDLSKYQNTSTFMRRLASTDVSVGSVLDENSDRRIGYAVKLNLFKQRDPLMARELYIDIGENYAKERHDLDSQLKVLRIQLDTMTNVLTKPQLRSTIRSMEDQMMTLNSRRNADINSRAKIFVQENWNSSSLDFSFGKVYSYKTDSAGSLKSLRLNRNTGWGAWLNGSLGIGRKFLLSALARTTWYQEELNFLIENKNTQEQVSQKAIADNSLYSVGMNLRYGGSIYTFFIEFLYEKKALKTPVEALTESFKTPGDFNIVASSVKWDVVHPNSFSFGGDWRVGKSVILNYGMRCIFDSHWKMQTFIPVATISCMMR
jgi:hypothetical protein